jgi:hypothetical protein
MLAAPIRVDVTGEENRVLDLTLILAALSQSKIQDLELNLVGSRICHTGLKQVKAQLF